MREAPRESGTELLIVDFKMWRVELGTQQRWVG